MGTDLVRALPVVQSEGRRGDLGGRGFFILESATNLQGSEEFFVERGLEALGNTRSRVG